jgi:F-type H+-transporting ATPase subunit b
MLKTPEFWVAVSFFAFMAVLLYYKVPALIAKALDDRADAIRKELDEARNLRREAQAILDDYQKKHGRVAEEAEAIVKQARREAEALQSETRKSLADQLDRRAKAAEEKVKTAEAQALAEIRSLAVDKAIAAAERIIAAKLGGQSAASLIDKSIADVKRKLN